MIMASINPMSRFIFQIKWNAIFSPLHKSHIEGVIISLPSDYECKRFANVENVMVIAIFNYISSDSYPSSNVKPRSRDYAEADCSDHLLLRWVVGKYKASIQAENGYRWCMASILWNKAWLYPLSLSLSHW